MKSTPEEIAARERDLAALRTFRARAKKAQPTKAHRPGIWENMLGTLYARNPRGETRYFDYDYTAAVAFVGEVEDVRVARLPEGSPWQSSGYDYQAPRVGQLVWFVKDSAVAAREE